MLLLVCGQTKYVAIFSDTLYSVFIQFMKHVTLYSLLVPAGCKLQHVTIYQFLYFQMDFVRRLKAAPS